jgi:hypothetical protein
VDADEAAARPVREDRRARGRPERDRAVEGACIAGQLVANRELAGRGRPGVGPDADRSG